MEVTIPIIVQPYVLTAVRFCKVHTFFVNGGIPFEKTP